MADGKMFKLKIISPNRVFYDGEVSMVELETKEGRIGVYAGHIPLVSVLVPGVANIHEASGTRQAAVHAGFVQIDQQSMTVLAETAEWPEEIDVHRAEEAKIRAERRLNGDGQSIDVTRAEMALRRSLIRLSVSGK